MDHNGDVKLLCPLVKGEELVVVGGEVLIGWIELEAPDSQFPNTSLQFRYLVEGDVRVNVSEGNKPSALLTELSHPVVCVRSGDHGISLRKGHNVIDPLFIHECEQALGRGQNGLEICQSLLAIEPPHPL